MCIYIYNTYICVYENVCVCLKYNYIYVPYTHIYSYIYIYVMLQIYIYIFREREIYIKYNIWIHLGYHIDISAAQRTHPLMAFQEASPSLSNGLGKIRSCWNDYIDSYVSYDCNDSLASHHLFYVSLLVFIRTCWAS